MIKNIVFDVGKVLIGWSPEKSMDMIGFSPEEKQAVMNALFTDKKIWNEEDRGVLSREEMSDYLVSQAPELEGLIRKFYENAVISVTPMEYSREWISNLKKGGYGVYVLSNFGEYAQKRAVELGAINFLDLVDGYIFSYMIKEIKPDRAIYDALCDRYGLEACECLFIDDVEENIRGAEAAGMQGMLFTGYEEALDELGRLGVEI
ncbi:MAG: HAD family phosphatase [Lachnospiraceae bacterium]|nr:HAD family phosphatase [Lachnospiraceae bacterium]